MKKYILTFILALIFFVTANAPAFLLKPYMNNVENFHINNISGSVWKGSVSSNHFNKLNWSINPFYLLLGSISADIDTTINSNNSISATANISLLKKLQLKDVKAKLTTNYLQQLNPTLPIMVQAKVIINIPQIIWDDITAKTPLVFLQGNANIQNVNLMGEQLGSYDAVFSYKNNLISSTITSSESSKINTNINLTVNQKLKLTVKGNLTPKTNNLENIFQELGINNLQNHSYNL
jgi:hypothetical protein